MNKHYFHLLLSKYQDGTCTAKEKQLVDQWFLLIGEKKPNHTAQEYLLVEDRIWQAIQDREPNTSENIVSTAPVVRLWLRLAAAAVLLAMLGGGLFLKNQYFNNLEAKRASKHPKGLLTKTNQADQLFSMRLEDGTLVSLSPRSTIHYPSRFEAKKREVYLEGKAYFDVTRNPEMPFLVHTEEVATEVLGTSFWVNAQSVQNFIEVSVVTGKVSVFQKNIPNKVTSGKAGNGVIITPNQKVKYLRENEAFVTGLVDYPIMDVTFEKAFSFDDTPVAEVITTLEKAYGVDIELENEKTNSCLITADIGKLPMFTKLDLICSSMNARYEVRGTKILISKGRCTDKQP